jgi:hypothetical protein
VVVVVVDRVPSRADGVYVARSLEDLLKTSHHSKEKYTLATPADVLFASNNSCVLSPEVTEGPYCEYLYLSSSGGQR